MPVGLQYGVSASGLPSCRIRDLDVLQPRQRLPARALPDSVRATMGFTKPVAVAAEAGGADAPAAAPRAPAAARAALPLPTLLAALPARKSLAATTSNNVGKPDAQPRRMKM